MHFCKQSTVNVFCRFSYQASRKRQGELKLKEYENQSVSILCPGNVHFFDMRDSVERFSVLPLVSEKRKCSENEMESVLENNKLLGRI